MKISLFFLFIIIAISASGDECQDCWTPELNFDIEGKGFIESMIFISGYSYALSKSNELLSAQGKENYFCKFGSVGSKELIEILNQNLSGEVSAEMVNATISEGLIARYPCDKIK